MKKILLLHHNRDRSNDPQSMAFAELMGQKLQGVAEVVCSDIEELVFEVSANSARIYHPAKGFDVKDFDLVAFRHVSTFVEEAHAVTLYCEKLGIKYIDSYLNRYTLDKMSASFLHWSHDLPVPRTLFGPVDELIRRLPDLGEKAVFKDNHGFKGERNFVVTSGEEMRTIVSDNPATRFVLQEFIPNKGDLRVLVFNYKPVLIIKRTAAEDGYLNNTSQGGSAEIVPIDSIDQSILDISVEASRAEKLEVSGVDIITDDRDGASYILEVNQAPQVSSGSFMEEKADKYAELLKELVNG